LCSSLTGCASSFDGLRGESLTRLMGTIIPACSARSVCVVVYIRGKLLFCRICWV
jgi:hypothetical protein